MTLRRQGLRALLVTSALACTLGAALGSQADTPPVTTAPVDTPDAVAHVRAATAIAGSDLTVPLFLCRADSTSVVRQALEAGSTRWVEPTRAFDNLYYVGNEFVGVWALRTSAGLILFDASSSADEAEHHLVPGLVKLGLDPAQIKYVIITHGHWDHFGGAAYLQRKFGARIALGAPDWDLIEKAPPGSLETKDHPIPRHDIAVVDGQRITLGDTTVTLYLTPGHTPGTVSALVPVHEGGQTYTLSLFGSVAFPPSLEPTERTGGLRRYDDSVVRFGDISRRAGTLGILNTHVFAEGALNRLALARSRRPGQPNPFLIGLDATVRYYALLHECLQAAESRPQVASDWGKPPSSVPLHP
ncbi:MAG: MBL fold metallo-hydrolase [Polyangiaceae bacterium]